MDRQCTEAAYSEDDYYDEIPTGEAVKDKNAEI